MVGIRNKVKKKTSSLPYDITENILCRLPVKSLLRFKTISKSWEATISDPGFARTYLQQSKNSTCQNLIVWHADGIKEAHVVKLENQKFRIESVIPYPQEKHLHHMGICYCDGLVLKRCGNLVNKMYMLWNPSSRTYKKFCCPYPIARSFTTVQGLCYDPSIQDYKVVITDMKRYAVFYCRNNYWTEMKETKEFSCSDKLFKINGVSLNGAFYWALNTKRAEEGFGRCSGFEIVCFDSRNEKFKKLPKPDCTGDNHFLCLTSLGGQLCLFLTRLCAPRDEMSIMKKVGDGDSWMEFKVRLPFSCPFVIPVCLMKENEIILEIGDSRAYILYNQSKNTFAEIQKSPARMYSRPVPYQENLFFSSPNKWVALREVNSFLD
ncbi:hypothetical protein Pfo_026601 [Paulownia fortunei]|nr:hypothetical protein Pfo_026601 [Paulownia fortunei]